MRGGRMLMDIGLLVLVGAAVIGGIMVVSNILQPSGPDIPLPEEGTPGGPYIPPPEEMTKIVVAAQPVMTTSTSLAINSRTIAR